MLMIILIILKCEQKKVKKSEAVCFLPASSTNYNSSEAPNSGLAKLNPSNSLPLRLDRMYLEVGSGGVSSKGSLLNCLSKFSALRGSL